MSRKADTRKSVKHYCRAVKDASGRYKNSDYDNDNEMKDAVIRNIFKRYKKYDRSSAG